jgi:hypothetical protein
MHRSLVTALLLLSASGTPAAAEETASSVLARAKEASGGAAWDRVTAVHLKGRLTTSGLQGTAESFDDVRRGRYLERYELGPVSGADGFDGARVWSMDQARQVREEEGGEARLAAVNESYRRRLAYWYPDRGAAKLEYRGTREEQGRSFQVVTITPEGGRPFDLWMDAASGLVDRTVEKMAIETRTSFFSDHRRVQGVLLPFRIRTTNGDAKYDQLVELTEVQLDEPLADTLFAMPAPPPPDFEFAAGRTSTTVPFTLVNNHIYVDVKLDGKGPYRLLCDTGGANIVTPSVAKALGLEVKGALQGRGVGDSSVDVGLAQVKTLAIGDVTLRDQVFAVFPLEDFAKVEGIEEHGLIGYEVFKRFVVEVSYGRSQLTVTLPSAFRYAGKGTAVPFVFNAHVPQVEGEIDGIRGKFDIDTGSRASLDLLAPFAEKHALARKYHLSAPMVTGWGVGGPSRSRVGRARLLKLGDVAVKAPVASISLAKKGAFSDPYVAGNVGAGVLKRFDLTFDYQAKRIWFERNGNDGQPDTFDRSGMWVNQDAGAYVVMDVMAGGPADRAGLRAGDRIVSVDGTPAAARPVHELRTILRTRPAGQRVKLEVETAGKRRPVTLVLRDLAT